MRTQGIQMEPLLGKTPGAYRDLSVGQVKKGGERTLTGNGGRRMHPVQGTETSGGG